MKKNIFMTGILFLLVSGVFFSDVSAQKAVDQYGFGSRGFLIQSAMEVGKSANGLWDVPGDGNLPKYNTKKNWPNIVVWARDKGKDGPDRIYQFSPAQGSAAGRYFIKFKNIPHWGVNAVVGTGNVEARSRVDHFELKYLGNERWKIYYNAGTIVCLDKQTTKNGTNIVLRPDQNGPHTEWVFFDASTNKAFIPRLAAKEDKKEETGQGLEEALSYGASGNKVEAYFMRVSYDKFRNEDKDTVLIGYLNNMGKDLDQYNLLLKIVDAIQDNKDTNLRRNVAMRLSRVNVRKGDGFAAGILKSKTGDTIRKKASAERDATTKGYLNQLADNFK